MSRSLNSPAPCSHWPPSITTHSPLIYCDMSLIRNAARLVSSWCLPKRFMGFELRECSSNSFEGMSRDQAPSVGNGPGAMALRRMLYLPHSTASEVVIARTPALAHDRRNHETRAAIRRSVGRRDAQNIAGLFLRDPSAGEGLRAVKRAVEHDADHGVEGVGGKFFRASHEISGGVVDDGVDAAEFGVGFVGGGFDGSEIADVARGVSGRASGFMDGLAGFLERFFAAADDEHFRAERREVQRHGAAQAGAAAAQEDGAVFQKSGWNMGHRPRRTLAIASVHSSRLQRGVCERNLRSVPAETIAPRHLDCASRHASISFGPE